LHRGRWIAFSFQLEKPLRDNAIFGTKPNSLELSSNLIQTRSTEFVVNTSPNLAQENRTRNEDETVRVPSYRMKQTLALSLTSSVVKRALKYAVVVGSILIVINHSDAILRGDVPLSRLFRMGLTVIVPYVVSTLSSVGAMKEAQRPPGTE